MTDRDVAIALGEYINSLLAYISALQTLMPDYQQDDIKKVLQNDEFYRLSAGQRATLMQSIGDETQASSLLHALSRNFSQA
jgi:predicted exporter